jgi:hypothetical protein
VDCRRHPYENIYWYSVLCTSFRSKRCGPSTIWPLDEAARTAQTPDVEIKTDTEVTRLRRENAELKKLVEQLEKQVELLEQSTKVNK